MAPASAAEVRLATIARRHVALTALRWLPTGLLIPVLVVLMQSRGLSLAQVGLVSATQGITVLLLELPTGGLADALGRRPVLILASVLDLASLALVAAAHTPGAFMVAWAVQGVYRALESGPLDAWYVDASQAVDPAADIEAGLGRAGTAIGLAIGGGALAAAGLTTWWPAGGVDPLVVPVLVAMAVRVSDIGAQSRLLSEARRGASAARAVALDGPRVVRRTVALVVRSPALRALVGVELSWGAGLVAIELFSAPRLVELVGSATSGVAAFGVAAAGAWTVSALGSALTSRVIEGVGASPARVGAGLRVVQGGMAAMMAVVGGPVAMVAGYLGFYLVHGMANVVHYGMVHRLVGPDERTTVVSAHSLGARCGGIVAALALGPVAERAGIAPAMLVSAGLLASAAPLYRIAGRHARPVASAGIGPPTLASSDMATEVRDVPARTRYEITLDGELAGFAAYRDVDRARVFTHTEVFDAFEGKGVGSALARGALDQVRAGIGRAVALCPFIARFVEQHDEYADLLDPALDRRLRDEAGRK